MQAAGSGDRGTSPILGARVHRDPKQGSELLISLLVLQHFKMPPLPETVVGKTCEGRPVTWAEILRDK
jgi:hypothetical protein